MSSVGLFIDAIDFSKGSLAAAGTARLKVTARQLYQVGDTNGIMGMEFPLLNIAAAPFFALAHYGFSTPMHNDHNLL